MVDVVPCDNPILSCCAGTTDCKHQSSLKGNYQQFTDQFPLYVVRKISCPVDRLII